VPPINNYNPNFVLVEEKLLLLKGSLASGNKAQILSKSGYTPDELYSVLTKNQESELKTEKDKAVFNSSKKIIDNYLDPNKINFSNKAEMEILTQEIQKVVEKALRENLNTSNHTGSKTTNSKNRFFSKENYLLWNYFLIITVLIIGSINLYFAFNPLSRETKIAQASDTFLVNQNDNATGKIGKIGNKVVTNFLGNPALTEYGFKVKANKNSIQTVNDGNCKTQIIPPEGNGCNFVIAPSLLGLPKRGIALKTLTLAGSMGGDSKVILDIKNYEKGILQKRIAEVTGSDLNTPIKLPQNLDSFQAISFRFWEKDTPIEVNKMIFSYFYTDNLTEVSGRLVNFEATENDNSAQIYWDANENGVYDIDIDEKQDCRYNFPGVFAVNFEKDGAFKVKRDSACFKDVKPDIWYTDEGKNSLPPGKFLLLFDKTKRVIPFEIQTSEADKNLVLDYQKR